ncbi:peptidylprolyl isomerase [Corallococcus sp. M34]|uniref:peptidylprolyl isomerase n=1 Tax=Citreicoccus inhibens TaxID=2849499 RepID=UPI001C2430FD|nr:peptidylprolyl isomerase [Citreicoccus inhibens]MBU8896454.1 peptidylprolyl isomerase [Citreicoccus inhibens]
MVAKVGRTPVTRADVALWLQTHEGAGAVEGALDAVVERTLLVEKAREDEFLKDPEVAARVEAARREVIANAYLDRVARETSTEESLSARYEARREGLARREVHVAHIVVRLAMGADRRARAEAQAKINAAHARIVSGADFAAVARELSEDTVTGALGGDLGLVREGQVDARFFGAVVALKPGEVSEPFETDFGLHVARALEAPRTVLPTFQEVRGQMAAEARHEAEEMLMRRLREDIPVRRYPERLSGVVGTKKAEGEQ